MDADVINSRSEADFHANIHRSWTFLVDGQNAAPVWVSDFSTANDGSGSDEMFVWIKNYLHKHDLDWSYWEISGSEGILDSTWSKPAAGGWLVNELKELQEMRREIGPREASPAQTHGRDRGEDSYMVSVNGGNRHDELAEGASPGIVDFMTGRRQNGRAFNR